MTLHKFVTVLRRRKWLVATILLLAVAGSGVGSALATRTYTATAGLYFSVRTATGVDDLAVAATFSQTQLASYATLAMTPEVLEPVADELDVDGGVEELAGQVAVTALDGTVVLEVAVTDTDPAQAARLANAIADRVITVVEDLSPSTVDAEGATVDESAVEVTVVTPATAPESPSSPNVLLNLAAGAVLGLGLGVLLAVGRDVLDTRVRGAEDVAEVTRTPVIGALGVEPGRKRGVLMETAPHSPQAEAYRQLRTNLHFLELGQRGQQGRHRAVSVSSSLAAEGKSTVAVNLAVALAETGARVLLVDADLRRPSVARVLGIEGAAGLTTVLLGQADVDDVVQPWGGSGLHVLPAGPLPPNPTELIGSVPMRRLLDELRVRYDHVVLDSAPLLPVADSAVLAGLVDGTLLLANGTKVRRHQLAESLRTLARVDAPVLGIVLNEVARDDRVYGYYAAEEPSAAPTRPADRPDRAEPAPAGR
ncbi:polysaccharide biosynthesis tyrosine autokinase [Geodermatophilus sp. SYSU D00815]